MAGQVPLWREEEAGPLDLHPALGTLGLFPVSPRLEGMSQFRRATRLLCPWGFSVQTRILDWVAMPSSRGSSQPRDQTRIYYISCTGTCLENPRDGGAWWAAVYEVAQSRTRLK